MTPVKQTPGKGNCLQAAIATVLDLALDDVPDFADRKVDGDGKWFDDVATWVKEKLGRGVVAFNIDGSESIPEIRNVNAIVVGKTSRGKDDHAVVCEVDCPKEKKITFKFVHDPHRSNKFLTTLEYGIFFV